jgi:cytochrome c oxidase cbb3-type subunit III
MRTIHAIAVAAILSAAATLAGQEPAKPPATPPATPPAAKEKETPALAHPRALADPEAPKFDPEAVERGKQLMVAQCGFCHGSNARGGEKGPDLTRSEVVQGDEGGVQLGAFLKAGRPEKGMPKFTLPDEAVQDLATYLHATIASVANRDRYKILDILVGDPKKGEAFFNGAGKCVTCHSVTGDLAGIGSKFDDPAVLQGRIVMPRGRRRRGPPRPGQNETPPFLEPMAIKASFTTPSGESVDAPLIMLTDFSVTVYDATTGQPRTFLRGNGQPAVTVTDPLQAHVDMVRRWNDADLHDMTAFLASLKDPDAGKETVSQKEPGAKK